ncbi:MAG: hypothetical protein A2583_05620 [Bdellovibrionales bacterium RIFOXYD1_FULL_53_11]|nr:MAG: hypothetical protein A2583_05620 [Bdellovibrionales bacterium RIFOXYD1_FULL_53_11]
MEADIVRGFLINKTGRGDVGHEEGIFTGKLLDSFGVLELISFLEDEFGIEIDTTRHELSEFDTIDGIVALIKKLRADLRNVQA